MTTSPLAHVVGVCLALLLCACRTVSPDAVASVEEESDEPKYVMKPFLIGRVMHVNMHNAYVVIRCAGLPSLGEEAKVYRENRVVATLSVTGPLRTPFAAADMIDGYPREGDRVVVFRRVRAPQEDGRSE